MNNAEEKAQMFESTTNLFFLYMSWREGFIDKSKIVLLFTECSSYIINNK